MSGFLDLLWPRPVRESGSEKAEREGALKADLSAIGTTVWKEALLDEVRALAEREAERKRAAEGKASIYLAVIAAIVPVSSSLVTDYYGQGFDTLPSAVRVLTLVLFVAGLLALLASGLWAFRTLAVSTHTTIDVDELLSINAESDPRGALMRDMLRATRINRDGVNAKVLYIRLAHEFLLRTFLAFGTLIAVIVLWPSAAAILQLARRLWTFS